MLGGVYGEKKRGGGGGCTFKTIIVNCSLERIFDAGKRGGVGWGRGEECVNEWGWVGGTPLKRNHNHA